LDVKAWWETLTHRMRRIAHDLAIGWSTSEVALRHGLSASRISQLRRALAESWAAFQKTPMPASPRSTAQSARIPAPLGYHSACPLFSYQSVAGTSSNGGGAAQP